MHCKSYRPVYAVCLINGPYGQNNPGKKHEILTDGGTKREKERKKTLVRSEDQVLHLHVLSSHHSAPNEPFLYLSLHLWSFVCKMLVCSDWQEPYGTPEGAVLIKRPTVR